MRNFGWSGRPYVTTKAKIRWEIVCSSKDEGGLGIPKLEIWIRAVQLKHIGYLCKGGDRDIWVDWFHANFLKGGSSWSVKTPSLCSWTWKKLLKLCDLSRHCLPQWEGNCVGSDNTEQKGD